MSNRFPAVVVAADWTIAEEKRWMARAERVGSDEYLVHAPEPVGELSSLVARLREQVGSHESVLLAFAFPIGLPRVYASRTGLESFRTALGEFGRDRWREFFVISDLASLYQPFSPPPTQIRGDYKAPLARALGVSTLSELQRQCELATSTHRAAECLFFTLGGAQVDAGAIVGWHRVIQPSLDELKIWPFDGVLEDLLAEPGVTIAEIYPADGCGHLDIKIGSGTGRTKTKRPDRQESFRHCLERFTGGPIRLSKPARSWAEWGFMREDDFDAMVGLLSTLLIVTDARRTDVPQDAYVRGIEGWILGQEFMNGSSR